MKNVFAVYKPYPHISISVSEAMPDSEAQLINEIVDFDKNDTQWQRILLATIAIRNFCHEIRSNGDVHILGRRANVRAVESMYNWLEPQIIKLANKSDYKRSDKTAYILGIISRLRDMLDEGNETYKRNNPTSTALVSNIKTQSDQWYKSQYPNATNGRQHYANVGAFNAGHSAGSSVSIYGNNRQVATGRLQLGA